MKCKVYLYKRGIMFLDDSPKKNIATDSYDSFI